MRGGGGGGVARLLLQVYFTFGLGHRKSLAASCGREYVQSSARPGRRPLRLLRAAAPGRITGSISLPSTDLPLPRRPQPQRVLSLMCAPFLRLGQQLRAESLAAWLN